MLPLVFESDCVLLKACLGMVCPVTSEQGAKTSVLLSEILLVASQKTFDAHLCTSLALTH